MPYAYPLDLTGTALTNRIPSEVHTFTLASDRSFVPDGGPFYTMGLVVRHGVTNDILVPSLHYDALHMLEEAGLESQKEVCCIIHVKDDTVPSVSLDYQVIGGAYSETSTAIRQLLLDNPPIGQTVWGQIIGAPVQFTPAAHYHPLNQIFGMGALITALENMRIAIVNGDNPSIAALYQYINTRLINENYVTQDQLAALQTVMKVSTYQTIAALRGETTFHPYLPYFYIVSGRDDAADGKGHIYRWDPTSVEVDDGEYIIRPDSITSPSDPGRFIVLLRVEQQIAEIHDLIDYEMKPVTAGLAIRNIGTKSLLLLSADADSSTSSAKAWINGIYYDNIVLADVDPILGTTGSDFIVKHIYLRVAAGVFYIEQSDTGPDKKGLKGMNQFRRPLNKTGDVTRAYLGMAFRYNGKWQACRNWHRDVGYIDSVPFYPYSQTEPLDNLIKVTGAIANAEIPESHLGTDAAGLRSFSRVTTSEALRPIFLLMWEDEIAECQVNGGILLNRADNGATAGRGLGYIVVNGARYGYGWEQHNNIPVTNGTELNARTNEAWKSLTGCLRYISPDDGIQHFALYGITREGGAPTLDDIYIKGDTISSIQKDVEFSVRLLDTFHYPKRVVSVSPPPPVNLVVNIAGHLHNVDLDSFFTLQHGDPLLIPYLASVEYVYTSTGGGSDVGSTSVAAPAMLLGTLIPEEVQVTITVTGQVIGAGGAGGTYPGPTTTSVYPPEDGGAGLRLMRNAFINNLLGSIIAGGGGGGGTGQNSYGGTDTYSEGGGGGGGAGHFPGAGGNVVHRPHAANGYGAAGPGATGTTMTGGAGGTAGAHSGTYSGDFAIGGPGGNGGDLGQPGGDGGYGAGGDWIGPTLGGAAGKALIVDAGCTAYIIDSAGGDIIGPIDGSVVHI